MFRSAKRLDLNISFHMTLFSPCKGHMAYDLYEKNLRYISIIRKYYQIDLDRSKQTIVEHRDIIKAIKDNDLEEALEATRKHSKSSKRQRRNLSTTKIYNVIHKNGGIFANPAVFVIFPHRWYCVRHHCPDTMRLLRCLQIPRHPPGECVQSENSAVRDCCTSGLS